MANTSDIKNGMVLNHNNGLWQIVEFLHVKPGKGAAFVRTKLKNIETGKVVDHTFNAGHKIDPVRIETREHQFLYNDDDGYHFMNTDTYEQVRLEKHLISAPQFLKDGTMCLVVFHAELERRRVAEGGQLRFAEPRGTRNYLHGAWSQRRYRDEYVEASDSGHGGGSARALVHRQRRLDQSRYPNR